MEGVKTLLQSSNRSTIWRVDLPRRPPFVSKEFSLSSRDSNLEISLHEKLSHIPGVLRGSGSNYEGKPRLLTEYCERGSFRSFFVLRKEPLSEAELLGLYSQMARTVRLVHEQGVIHGAISAENWLLTADMQPKLIDFGHAQDLSVSEPIAYKAQSSERLPEHLSMNDATSLSMVFYQMATRDFNAEVLSMSATDIKLACGQRGYSHKVHDEICQLLQLHSPPYPEEFDLETFEMQGGMVMAASDYLFPSLSEIGDDYCSFCKHGRPARRFAPCDHLICALCERRITELYNELICELCRDTVSLSPMRIVPTKEYEFSNIDLSRLF